MPRTRVPLLRVLTSASSNLFLLLPFGVLWIHLSLIDWTSRHEDARWSGSIPPPFLTSVVDGMSGRLRAPFTLHPRLRKYTRCTLCWRFHGPQSRSGLNREENIPVTFRGDLYCCEMLRIPHCLDNRLIDGSKVAFPTHRPRSTLEKHLFHSVSGTHFC
jgi:hypothetical protein